MKVKTMPSGSGSNSDFDTLNQSLPRRTEDDDEESGSDNDNEEETYDQEEDIDDVASQNVDMEEEEQVTNELQIITDRDRSLIMIMGLWEVFLGWLRSVSSVGKVDNKLKKRRGFKRTASLSPKLRKIVGAQELVRTKVVKRIWPITDDDSEDGYESEVNTDVVGGGHEELVDDEFSSYGSENIEVVPGINKPNMGEWEGHLVNESCVDILCNIRREHPETFQNFKFQNEAAYTFALNTLGEFYVSFASKPVAGMGVDDMVHFRGMFSDLEVFNFDVEWLQKRIDYIEELRFKSPLVAELVELKKRKETRERDMIELKKELAKKDKDLAELKVLCASKANEVRARHGYLGENVNTCKAADGLLGGYNVP